MGYGGISSRIPLFDAATGCTLYLMSLSIRMDLDTSQNRRAQLHRRKYQQIFH